LALFHLIFTRLLKFEVQNFKPWTDYCLLFCSNSFCIWNIFHLYFFLSHCTKYLDNLLHSFIFHKMHCGSGLLISNINVCMLYRNIHMLLVQYIYTLASLCKYSSGIVIHCVGGMLSFP
jgi:hypothetical protein